MVMFVVTVTYLTWLYFSPLNALYGPWPGIVPSLPLLVSDTLLYILLAYPLVRRWLRTMFHSHAPAIGINFVEPGDATPEQSDEYMAVTRLSPMDPEEPPKVPGPKSDLREAPAETERKFLVKLPDIETGKSIFDVQALLQNAMIRSRVTSGGWIKKRASMRSSGSMKSVESDSQGRVRQARMSHGTPRNIHIAATVLAAVTRLGRHIVGPSFQIRSEDLREKILVSRAPLTVILVIDVSMSMINNMGVVRNIIERIEQEVRGSRDRTGVIAFKDNGAVEVVSPTSNWNKIYRALGLLRVSGLTPLATGMMRALETVRRERMRCSATHILVVLISDFAPNIPLSQSVGPYDARYAPVRDLVYAARVLRREGVGLATINLNREHSRWSRILKLPYHDAIELATMLRMRKEGLNTPAEVILSVPEFRRDFISFLIAREARGRTFLSTEVLQAKSILALLLQGVRSKGRLSVERLRSPESYI